MILYKLLLLITYLLFTLTNINAQQSVNDLSTAINGLITNHNTPLDSRAYSENGKYFAVYNIGGVTDEYRELFNFNLSENGIILFTLQKSPGSDFAISNSGFVLFFDHSKHFMGELKIYGYSKYGSHIFTTTFLNADQFSFSESGNSFGVMASDNLHIIDLLTGENIKHEKGSSFAISEDGTLTAIVTKGKLNIHGSSSLLNSFPLNIDFIRKVKLSSADNLAAVINKRKLIVYNLADGSIVFSKVLNGELSFKDLKIFENKIVTGVHKKTNDESSGILRIYNLQGNLLEEKEGKSKLLTEKLEPFVKRQNQSGYDPIPWPFAPFDSMRTVWNHYEQHMGNGGGEWSYLHQGLDLITPVAEPTYAVEGGIVKLVLTIGGAAYWRIAISDTQVAGYSDGWLYAHLIESSIQFDVGDNVQIHDYLGDIIEWSSNWGHIHFVEIRDSGLVWYYNDNEWGINFNPMLALQPLPDTTAPVIEPVFGYSKFGFCANETSNYLTPDSLLGDVDIIVKVVDYAGDSQWQQPAFRTYYWIKSLATGDTILTRGMGHILNHTYPFYSGENYEPYAVVMYKRDNILTTSSWMDLERNYYHIVTNSNGDSLLELSEKDLAFSTANYYDGDYRIFIEAFDEAGNYVIDSMDVTFKNGNPVSSDDNHQKLYTFNLEQNYPNPFNPTTTIRFTIPTSPLNPSPYQGEGQRERLITLKVYDVLGNEIATLANEELPAGSYEVDFNAASLPSGIYFYQLRTGSFIETKKMVLIK
ncbi:MAG: T9SS type A sorting domain-containing protein [Ignavibacteriaceae bacterium]